MKKTDGIAVVSFAPSSVKTNVNGVNITIDLETEYPFDENLSFSIQTNGNLQFYIRIPKWAKGATVQIDQEKPVSGIPGRFFQMTLKKGVTKVLVILPMTFEVSRGVRSYATVTRGPLVYGLEIGEKWKKLAHYYMDSYDWQINNMTEWNFAIQVNDTDPNSSFKWEKNNIDPKYPFNYWNPPCSVSAVGKRVEWDVVANAADLPPQSPVSAAVTLPTPPALSPTSSTPPTEQHSISTHRSH